MPRARAAETAAPSATDLLHGLTEVFGKGFLAESEPTGSAEALLDKAGSLYPAVLKPPAYERPSGDGMEAWRNNSVRGSASVRKRKDRAAENGTSEQFALFATKEAKDGVAAQTELERKPKRTRTDERELRALRRRNAETKADFEKQQSEPAQQYREARARVDKGVGNDADRKLIKKKKDDAAAAAKPYREARARVDKGVGTLADRKRIKKKKDASAKGGKKGGAKGQAAMIKRYVEARERVAKGVGSYDDHQIIAKSKPGPKKGSTWKQNKK